MKKRGWENSFVTFIPHTQYRGIQNACFNVLWLPERLNQCAKHCVSL